MIVGVFINLRWCQNYKVRERFCNENIEFMSITLRPYYLPREFNKICLIIVYIPNDANYNAARSNLLDQINLIQNDSPNALKIIAGDFNQANFNRYIINYTQYVKFFTRGVAVLNIFIVMLRADI